MAAKLKILFKNKIFRTFCFSFILIIVIISAIVGISFSSILSKVKSDYINNNIMAFNMTKDINEGRINDIYNISKQLILNRNIVKLSFDKNDMEGIGLLQTKSISEILSQYTLSYDFIDEIVLVYNEWEIFVGTKYSTAIMRETYQNKFNFIGKSYDEIIELSINADNRIKFLPFQSMILNERQGDYFILSQKLSGKKGIKEGVTAFFFVNKDKMIAYLKKIQLSEGGFIYLEDGYGKKIEISNLNNIEINKNSIITDRLNGYDYKRINKEEYIVVYVKSNFTNWVYYAGYPKKGFYIGIKPILSIIIFMLVAIIIIGSIFSIYLSYNSYLPYKLIIDEISEFDENSDAPKDYDYIKNKLHQMNKTNSLLKSEIKKQEYEMHSALIKSLLDFEINDTNLLDDLLKKYNMNIISKELFIIIIKINGTINADRFDLINKQLIAEFEIELCNDIFIQNKPPNKYMIICGNTDELMLKNVVEKIVKKINYSVTVGISNMCDDLINIGIAYAEANNALDYLGDDIIERVTFYSDVLKNSDMIFYSQEIEQKIINLLLAGDKYGAIDLFDEIIKKNFIDRKLTQAAYNSLISSLSVTIKRFINTSIKDSEEKGKYLKISNKLLNVKNVNEFYELLLDLVDCSHKSSLRRKELESENKINDIIDFIKESFDNPDICLRFVAEKFNFNEKYLSLKLKNEAGINFFNYIEELRMKKASKLLSQNENMSIEQIALESGYYNQDTFRKAFKRKFGVSPNKYKGERNN